MVYHLEVMAHGDSIVRDSFYSNVHSTLKKSVEDGLCWLNKRLHNLYQHSEYSNQEHNLTLQDMIRNGEIQYSFKVTRISPYYADNFELPNEEDNCKDLRPTHTIFNYDLQGNLEYIEIKYMNKDGSSAYVTRKYPNAERGVK